MYQVVTVSHVVAGAVVCICFGKICGQSASLAALY